MSDQDEQIEKLMEELKCVGDMVTRDSIQARMIEIDYKEVSIAGQRFMFCGIRMDNGFVAIGKPATCIDPSNWRDEIGKKISYDNTFELLWGLEAYRKMSKV